MRDDVGRGLRVGAEGGICDHIEGCLECRCACRLARFLVPSLVPAGVVVRGIGSLG